MIRIVLSNLVLLAFLAVSTTVGHAHQAFAASDTDTGPAVSMHDAANAQAVAGTGSENRHDSGTSLDCTGLAHCGAALLAANYLFRPLALAHSNRAAVRSSAGTDNRGVDPPPPRRQARLVRTRVSVIHR